ncbi:MAG: YgdI/YgdR family lipoprotein [Verrucomicrobiota bacterium]
MMKCYMILFLAGCLLLAGCMTRYNVTLSNGTVITAKGKPKLDEQSGRYVFTDATGKQVAVSAMRVKEIAPVGWGSDSSDGPHFKSRSYR